MKLNYNEWVKCGLALTQLGEEGRDYFLKVSINEFYNNSVEEINEKYDNLLNTTEGKITLASLFQIAKDHEYEYPEIEELVNDDKDFAVELKEQFQLDDTRDPDKLLGFPLNKFKKLANNIGG